MSEEKLYKDFLGSWQLIPDSCKYQQGEPPKSGEYHIEVDGELLVFKMIWTDSEDKKYEIQFSGVPDEENAFQWW